MKAIKLNIDLETAKAGDVIEMEEGIAKHFTSKGWGAEVDDKPTPKAAAPVKKGRAVIGKTIPKA